MIIYKGYDQQQLDLQYDNRFHVPDFKSYLDRWESWSRLTERKYNPVKDIQYGDGPRELLDVFPSSHPASKTLIFIHGGYWQRFDKSLFHFVAGAFAGYDITTVLVNYPLAPAASMDEIVRSSRNAIKWISDHIDEWNGDPGQLYIAGHSAGAHLAAMILSGKPANRGVSLKAVCGLSGLYNLQPIQLSNLNQVLQMDKETANRNSPVFKKPGEQCPFLIAAGNEETNEFLDQSREMTDAWKNKNISTELMIVPGLNHFSILDSFCEKDSLLHTKMCGLMAI